MTEKQGVNHCFVDEAGDLVLFDKCGKVIVGSPGCSGFFMVKRLFRNLLHKADSNSIVFARRGKSERFEALSQAITRVQVNFEAKFGRPSDKPTRVHSLFSGDVAGLQVIDYCLWALQRLFERQEERYFDVLRSKFRLIIDLDDTRNHPYGEYYSDSNPLTAEKIKAF